MVLLHQYIFTKVYYFYVRVFKEKEIPHWFAGAVVSIILSFLLDGIYFLLLYCFYPSKSLEIFSGYLGHIGLATGLTTVIYVSIGDRYKRILSKVEKLDKIKKRRLGIIAVLYVLSVIAFILITVNLARAVHLGEV